MNYVDLLEKRGIEMEPADEGEVLIPCQFHNDNNPSCSVNIRSGAFYCFSCHEGGSFEKLLAKIDGVSIGSIRQVLMEADDVDESLAETLAILDGRDDDDDEIRYYSRRSFHRKFCTILDSEGSKYVRGRNISDGTMKRFDLRWADEGVMRERVILPVYTVDGRLLTYAGRAIDPDRKPKARKARTGLSTLYGLHEWLRDYGPSKHLVIVEGEFDAMYLQQFGVPAVSTMGTAKLSGGQLGLLVRNTKVVVMSYDGDEAGHKAQERAVGTLKAFMPVEEVILPDGRDPNDLSHEEVLKFYGGYVNG